MADYSKISDDEKHPEQYTMELFQSYESSICKIVCNKATGEETGMLDSYYWDYSVTTGKYRNQFLGETKAETQAKIDSGEYQLVDLN